MTARSGRFLLAAALGLATLPGCFPWQTNCRGPETVRKEDNVPSDNVAARQGLTQPPPQWPTEVSSGWVEFHKPASETTMPVIAEAQRPPAIPAPPEHPVSAYPVAAEPVPAAPPKTTPVATSKEPVKLAPLVLALQDILDDRHQDALRHLQAYDRETQEFYLRALPALTILARKKVEQLSAPEVAVLTEQIQSVLATLRPKTELRIDRMCFCDWVKAYGIYQPLPDSHAFVAPAGDRPGEVVRLYVEVRNFASAAQNGYYETRLASTIEIRDAHGQRVQVLDFKDGAKPLRSRTPLNDYYNSYTFLVPPLPAGAYQLILRIADETNPQARRVAQKALEFRVTPVGTRPN